MRKRTALAIATALVAIASCKGDSTPPSTVGDAGPADPGTPLEVLDRAQDVADDLEDRYDQILEQGP